MPRPEHGSPVFHTTEPKDTPPAMMCAMLNSTYAQLMFNVYGRANLGGGALKLELYELQSIPFPRPELIPRITIRHLRGNEWDVLSLSQQRRRIDRAVADALGLLDKEQEALYDGAQSIVALRKEKAKRK